MPFSCASCTPRPLKGLWEAPTPGVLSNCDVVRIIVHGTAAVPDGRRLQASSSAKEETHPTEKGEGQRPISPSRKLADPPLVKSSRLANRRSDNDIDPRRIADETRGNE